MANHGRRDFLKQTGALAAASTLAAGRIGAAANEELRLACIGCGGRAQELLKSFSKMNGVQVTTLCDVDDSKFGNSFQSIESVGGAKPRPEK